MTSSVWVCLFRTCLQHSKDSLFPFFPLNIFTRSAKNDLIASLIATSDSPFIKHLRHSVFLLFLFCFCVFTVLQVWGVCSLTCSREIRWEESSKAQAYLMWSLKGQAGTDGLWTAGYWKWGSKGSQSRESAWQFGTTIIATHTRLHSPPLSRQPARQPARHCSTTPNSFAARRFCNESTILHTYALHGTTLGSFKPPDGNIYKQVARAEPSINTLGSYLPLGVTPLAVREDQRSRRREEMEGGGLYGLFSAQAAESISRVLTGPGYGHFNPSCHFASGSKKTWSKCAKRFETPSEIPSFCLWGVTVPCTSGKELCATSDWLPASADQWKPSIPHLPEGGSFSHCVFAISRHWAPHKLWPGASSSSSCATRRPCLVPPRQGALGGFT